MYTEHAVTYNTKLFLKHIFTTNASKFIMKYLLYQCTSFWFSRTLIEVCIIVFVQLLGNTIGTSSATAFVYRWSFNGALTFKCFSQITRAVSRTEFPSLVTLIT